MAIFETSVTTSATAGFYPVYLFSTDMERLYLCIEFGTQQFTDTFGIKEGRTKIIQAVEKVRPLFARDLPDGVEENEIDLKSSGSKLHRGYEDAAIYCWASYRTDRLPTSGKLLADLEDSVKFYERMLTDPLMPDIEDLVASAALVAGQEVPRVRIDEVDFEPRRRKNRVSTPGRSGSRARRSKQSQKVGRAGEEYVFEREVKKLLSAGRPDLADRVSPHYKTGETPGWDITSYEETGSELLIEVKSTVAKTISVVELTRNEWKAARDPIHREKYRLYL